MKELWFFQLDLKFQLWKFKHLRKNKFLNLAPRTVRDKNVKCKQGENRLHKGEKSHQSYF